MPIVYNGIMITNYEEKERKYAYLIRIANY